MLAIGIDLLNSANTISIRKGCLYLIITYSSNERTGKIM